MTVFPYGINVKIVASENAEWLVTKTTSHSDWWAKKVNVKPWI